MKETKYRACSPEATAGFTPEELRANFHCPALFTPDGINLSWWEIDRTVVGGIMPVSKALSLEAPDFMKADAFCTRREVGLINIGGAGEVKVDDTVYTMDNLDGLYIGRGSGSVTLSSKDAKAPAKFYLLSYPAHAAYPTKHIPKASIEPLELGAGESANERKLYKVIQPETVESCQLVMGYTQIMPGSVWNTMPPHTHDRRSEVYCYFGMEDAIVVHLMGEPSRTRHIIMREGEAVLSPVWSIHAGAGTGPYSFIWGMGGENQDFTDMDHCDMSTFN